MAEKDELMAEIRAGGNRALQSEVFSVRGFNRDLYFRNPSIAQQDKYLPYILDSKLEGYVELIVQLVVENKHSKRKLFTKEDRAVLLNLGDPKEIQRIGEEMFKCINDSSIDSESAEKNSEATED